MPAGLRQVQALGNQTRSHRSEGPDTNALVRLRLPSQTKVLDERAGSHSSRLVPRMWSVPSLGTMRPDRIGHRGHLRIAVTGTPWLRPGSVSIGGDTRPP